MAFLYFASSILAFADNEKSLLSNCVGIPEQDQTPKDDERKGPHRLVLHLKESPPMPKLIGVFNIPRHNFSIP